MVTYACPILDIGEKQTFLFVMYLKLTASPSSPSGPPQSTDRTVRLEAESEEDRAAWLSAIESFVGATPGQVASVGSVVAGQI